jgi:hypothetical protein
MALRRDLRRRELRRARSYRHRVADHAGAGDVPAARDAIARWPSSRLAANGDVPSDGPGEWAFAAQLAVNTAKPAAS